MESSVSFLLLLLFSQRFAFTVAFECYQCNSLVDDHCETIGELSIVYRKECVHREEERSRSVTCDPNKPDDCENITEVTPTNCTATGDLRSIDDCDNQALTRPNFTICRKVEIWLPNPYVIILNNDGEKETKLQVLKPRISRQCGYKHEEGHDNACVPKRSRSSSQITCSCTQEGCNGGSRISLKAGIFYVLILFTSACTSA